MDEWNGRECLGTGERLCSGGNIEGKSFLQGQIQFAFCIVNIAA